MFWYKQTMQNWQNFVNSLNEAESRKVLQNNKRGARVVLGNIVVKFKFSLEKKCLWENVNYLLTSHLYIHEYKHRLSHDTHFMFCIIFMIK